MERDTGSVTIKNNSLTGVMAPSGEINMKTLKRKIKKVELFKNVAGRLTLYFTFEEGDHWSIIHLNEGLNFNLLDDFIDKGENLNTLVGKNITIKSKNPAFHKDGTIGFERVDKSKKKVFVLIDVDKRKEELKAMWDKMHKDL